MIDLMNGFINLFTNLEALFFVILAAFVGIVAGALPGLTASAAIAMLLPLSFLFSFSVVVDGVVYTHVQN